MEQRTDFALVAELYQEFQTINSYQEKVHFFDLHWGIIPFTPPPFDPELTWLFAHNSTFDLISLFLLEQDRRKNYYVKTFNHAAQTITFSINPFSKNHRIVLNKYIITKFLNTFAIWEKHERKSSPEVHVAAEWRAKLEKAEKTLHLLREKIAEKTAVPMHAKFRQVFFKGFTDKILNEDVLTRRKRFVELFLYAQGLLYAQYMDLLKKKAKQFETQPATIQPHLSKKLQVMEKMGFFSFLKTELYKEKRSKNQLIKEIYFLLSAHRSLPTKDENSLIENFLFADRRSANTGK